MLSKTRGDDKTEGRDNEIEADAATSDGHKTGSISRFLYALPLAISIGVFFPPTAPSFWLAVLGWRL